MAEALMLEMDGDSDGSITEEELVSLSFLPEVKNLLTQFKLLTIAVYFQTTPSSKTQGRGLSSTGSIHNPSCEQGLDFCSEHH